MCKFVSFLVIVFLSCNLHAQKPNFSWGQSLNFSKAVVIADNNNAYYFVEPHDNKIIAGILNSRLGIDSKTEISLDKNETYVYSYVSNKKFNIITSISDERDKTLAIYKYAINKDDVDDYQGEKCMILSYEGRKDEKWLHFVQSEDKSKIGMAYLQIGKRTKKYEAHLYSMNAEITEVNWTKELEIFVANKYLSIHDLQIDNNGKITVITTSFNEGKRVKEKNELLHILNVDNNSSQQFNIKLEGRKDIVYSSVRRNSPDNFIIAGLYKERDSESYGAFSVLLNERTETGIKLNENYVSLDEYYEPNDSIGKSLLKISELKPLDNGNMVLTAELFSPYIQNSLSSKQIAYRSNNLFVFIIEKGGNIKLTSILPKLQKARAVNTYDPLSGSAIVTYNSKIYILFNDNVRNLEAEKTKDKVYAFTGSESRSAIIVTKLSNEGVIEDKYIYKGRETGKLLVLGNTYITPNGMLLFKIKTELDKISVGQIDLNSTNQ